MHSALADTKVFPTTTFNLEGKGYNVLLFNSPHDPFFPEVDGTSIFLSKAYQHALLTAPPENMDFRYVRIDKDGELIGMLCFQVSNFNPGDSLKNRMNESLYNKFRYRLASLINLKVLCLGNTLLTGDYGFCFLETIPHKLRTLLMMKTIDWLLTMEEFKNINLVFVKDFYQDK